MNRKHRVALLDVDVLVALFDPDHIHHETAHDWFADHRRYGWATCPLSQNGFLRTGTRVARARGEVLISTLVGHFRTFISSGGHEFWSDDVSLLDEDLLDHQRITGHQQLTDAYLLALAVRHRGTLATFDQRIDIGIVRNAKPDDVTVLAPVQ